MGYKPHALMLVEQKIYEVRRLTVDGWRRRGQIHVELDGWRAHEEDWFSAMHGINVEITDPDRPRHAKSDNYVVTKTNFEKKKVSTHHRDGTMQEELMYGGALDITETWKSAWRRHGARIIDGALRYVVLPFSVAFGAGVAILWFQGLRDADQEPPDSTVFEAAPVRTAPTVPGDGFPETRTPPHNNTQSDRPKAHAPEAAHDPDDASASDQADPRLNESL